MDKPGLTELFIERDGFLRIALTKDKELVGLRVIRDTERPAEGDIYHGIIRNVSVSQKAVFVDIGTGRNAYLYVRDRKNIGNYHVGDGLTLEILRGESGRKGAKVTDEISLSDGNLVILKGKGHSFSKNVARDRFLEIHGSVPKIPGVHVMYRQGSLRLTPEELQKSLDTLAGEFLSVLKEAGQIRQPGRVFRDRYVLTEMVETARSGPGLFLVHCNDEEISRELKQAWPAITVNEYQGGEHIFFRHGLESLIQRLRRSQVPLPSGGSLIIEETEAMTAIDVNSGSAGTKGRPLDALALNLEALAQALREIDLRNLAGIIVIDFISMKKERDQARLYEAALAAVKGMTPLTKVYPLTELGLMQIARRRRGESLKKTLFVSDANRKLPVSASYLYKLIRIRLDESGWEMNHYEIITDPVHGADMTAIRELLALDYPALTFRYSESYEVDTVQVRPLII